MSTSWSKLRRDFPVTRNQIYLDHAAGGPIPLPVYRRIQSYYEMNIREADFAWMKWIRMRESVRLRIAEFIHAEPEEVTFIQSTSQGMNFIAELLGKEGTVLTNDAEFPSSTVPWLWRKTPIRFQKSKGGKIDLEETRSMLEPSVKTIVSSFVQYSTGYRQNLKALGAMKGNRYLVVNATQGFGAFPVNVKEWKADFLCSNSYKWLMAGYGGGVLYIRKKWINRFLPEGVGWRSMQNPESMNNRRIDLRKDAARYEWGCPSFPTIFAIGAAVEYLSGIGMEKISRRILDLTAYAIKQLENAGFKILSPQEEKYRSGIVIIQVKSPVKTWQRLLAQKIYVSARGGGLRLAPHFYNREEEIDQFIMQLKKLQQ